MKKGFTLIELLAVIVILAIITLIATPIILGIIEDARNEAKVRSGEIYITAVEQAIIREKMNGSISFNPSSCTITNSVITCEGMDEPLKVDIDGNLPASGTITFNNDKVDSYNLVIDGKEIVNGVIQESENFEPEYQIGEEVTFNPGDGSRTWNVIGEDENTVTLMLTENLGDPVAWYDYSHQNRHDNNYGPKDALEYLNSLTTTWNNVDSIESYTYINNLEGTEYPNGYRKIEITNGITKLTYKDETELTLNEEYEAKSRILSREEAFEISKKLNPNLEEENLRAYILRNLSDINTRFGINATTVSEVIANTIKITDYSWLVNESEYIQIYFIVSGLIKTYDVEPSYSISFPQFLHQELDLDNAPYCYWTLSSYSSASAIAWGVGPNDYNFCQLGVGSANAGGGVRPVITIPKSSL